MELISPRVSNFCREAATEPETFWARAAEKLHWFRKWDRVFERDYPTFRWFIGAETNLAYNCLDFHVDRGWGGRRSLSQRAR